MKKIKYENDFLFSAKRLWYSHYQRSFYKIRIPEKVATLLKKRGSLLEYINFAHNNWVTFLTVRVTIRKKWVLMQLIQHPTTSWNISTQCSLFSFPSHSEHVEGMMSSITDKLWGIYKESKDTGQMDTVSIYNGEETFVLKSVPSHGVADTSNRSRRQHGHGRGRQEGSAKQATRSACTLKSAPPNAAVARSPPSLLQSCSVKRAKHPSAAETSFT